MAYSLAFPTQCLLVRYDKHFWVDRDTDTDVETGRERQSSKLQKPTNPFSKGSLTASSLTIGVDSGESSEADESTTPQTPTAVLGLAPNATSRRTRLRIWVLYNPLVLLCWLCTLTLGVPLRYFAHHDVPLATSLLFSVWLTTLALQSSIQSSPSLLPSLRTLLSGLSNAVLWTALATVAYAFADASLSARPLATVLDTLQARTPLSSLLFRAATTTATDITTTRTTITAGDLATTLLSSGLVVWGLKLYAHRAHLFSRAGLAVCTVSSALALGNLVCGPLMVGRLLGAGVGSSTQPPGDAEHEDPGGRGAATALAFAARSVTIALAGPVMGRLGGDAGLNAAMVVGSGIGFQMGMGLGVGRWVEGWFVRGMGRVGGGRRTAREVEGREGSGGGDTETEGETRARTRTGEGDVAAVRAAALRAVNDPQTVAAGITVGINAAAMGTAYLYEVQSEAAPHAALSMIALGVMTVVFSSIPPLARWVVASVAG